MLNNQILAHRGFWKDRSEQNTLESLVKSLDLGFGIETDLRDRLGEIVISHDPPSEKTQLTLEKMLNTFQDHKNYKNVYYAMNIKADGLERSVIEILDRYGISKNCFVFDMSGPSTILFHKFKKELGSEIMICTRVSELEQPILYDQSDAVWIDEWNSSWANKQNILKYLNDGKLVALVSPELHKREEKVFWAMSKTLFKDNKKLLMCTDFPVEFIKYVEG